MGGDRGLQLRRRHRQLQITGPLRPEQGLAQLRAHLPIGLQGVDVALGDAAAQVRLDVLQVFGFGTVDVAGQVEVVVMPGDLFIGHEA